MMLTFTSDIFYFVSEFNTAVLSWNISLLEYEIKYDFITFNELCLKQTFYIYNNVIEIEISLSSESFVLDFENKNYFSFSIFIMSVELIFSISHRSTGEIYDDILSYSTRPEHLMDSIDADTAAFDMILPSTAIDEHIKVNVEVYFLSDFFY